MPLQRRRLAKLTVQPNDHDILIFDRVEDESSIVACSECGKYSECTIKGLQKRCPRELISAFSRGAYECLIEGKHPKAGKNSRVVFHPPIPIEQVASEAFQRPDLPAASPVHEASDWPSPQEEERVSGIVSSLIQAFKRGQDREVEEEHSRRQT